MIGDGARVPDRPVPVRPAARPRLLVPALGPFYAAVEPAAYAALRVLFGLTLVTHGYPKLFRLPHGTVADPFASATRIIADTLHFPAATLLAAAVTGIEFFGGLMLAAGLLTRLVAPMIAVQMAVIAFGVTWPIWAWTEHGMEYPVLMGALAAAMAIRGGDIYSLDRLIAREL